MKRTYRCPVIGAGTDGDDFRPSVARFAVSSWAVRKDFSPGAQSVTVEVEATLAQHTVIALDTTIKVLL